MISNYIMMYSIQQDNLYYENAQKKEKELKKLSFQKKLCICGIALMWGATSFLSFAIGYHYKMDDCNCTTLIDEL